ncbi:ATP-binding cassette domain-containing protein [Schaalia sp. lx-100]|uniref:ATP-binding cassette domain-containing protein n=1 Tax=Schaalia sp. lx-100 TaxID=2899081 RepID=UPI001E30C41D|nr:ABC transporter ATP-binding protein [Schaalia sp. lx-100]MCD4557439.1 ABC transporter ATP-binding protein [Schaalia sp. lx-100]
MTEVLGASGLVVRRGSFSLTPISFSLDENSGIVGLFGQNGAGKTTLLRALAGLAPITSGTVRRRHTQARRPVFLPDSPYLYGFLRVQECVDLMARYFSDFSRQRAITLIDELELDKRKPVNALSKGMGEQLSIALMLARDNDVYLFDEPLAAVDPVTRDVLVQIIWANIPPNAVALLSTHLIFGLQDLFDSYMVIHDGALVRTEQISTAHERENLESIVKEAILGG